MIVWINGAFGSGKTQAAFELQRRLADSFVYDPEKIGYFIRDNIPPEMKKSDFQHHKPWRKFNYEMLKYICGNYGGAVIVPMTVTDTGYFDEIIQSLRNDGIVVHHYILYASKRTLLKRLSKRLDGGNSWPARQIDRCINAFDSEITEAKIMTDSKDVYAVISEIAKLSGLSLLPDNRNRLQKFLQRAIIQIKYK